MTITRRLPRGTKIPTTSHPSIQDIQESGELDEATSTKLAEKLASSTFSCWADSDGNQVTDDTVFTTPTTLYAQWATARQSLTITGDQFTVGSDNIGRFTVPFSSNLSYYIFALCPASTGVAYTSLFVTHNSVISRIDWVGQGGTSGTYDGLAAGDTLLLWRDSNSADPTFDSKFTFTQIA